MRGALVVVAIGAMSCGGGGGSPSVDGGAVDGGRVDAGSGRSDAGAGVAADCPRTGWTRENAVPARRMRTMWVAGPQEAWVVTGAQRMWRWRRGRWCELPRRATDREIRALWGSGPDDAWAVGEEGLMLHWDGEAWSDRSGVVTADLRAVGGSGPGDVWVVGNESTALHWDGEAWTEQPIEGDEPFVRDVWSLAPGTAWVIGSQGVYRWTGESWSLDEARSSLEAIWARTADDVWAVGDGGTVLRYDGEAWTALDTGVTTRLREVGGGANADEVWMVGTGSDAEAYALRWDGEGFEFKGLEPYQGELTEVGGTGAGDVFALGDQIVQRWDGQVWTRISSYRPSAAHDLFDVSGVGTAPRWAVSARGIASRAPDGAWEVVESELGVALHSVWASAADDAWAVGDEGTIARWDGSAWKAIESGTRLPLHGVWASETTGDAWAVGGRGTILRWDGAGWAQVASPTSVWLYDVWGAAPDDVWAVGASGTTLHWDGAAWSAIDSASSDLLHAVHGSSADAIWAVGWSDGDEPAVLRWDGDAWNPLSVPFESSARPLYGVWARGAQDAWFVGDAGLTLHYSGGAWSGLRTDAPTLRALWGTADRVWAVGDAGTILRRE